MKTVNPQTKQKNQNTVYLRIDRWKSISFHWLYYLSHNVKKKKMPTVDSGNPEGNPYRGERGPSPEGLFQLWTLVDNLCISISIWQIKSTGFEDVMYPIPFLFLFGKPPQGTIHSTCDSRSRTPAWFLLGVRFDEITLFALSIGQLQASLPDVFPPGVIPFCCILASSICHLPLIHFFCLILLNKLTHPKLKIQHL